MGNQILNMPFKKLGVLATDCTMKSLWEFLSVHNLKLTTDIKNMQLPRKGGVLIMEMFVRNGISGYKLMILNKCRIFLAATWLSDIATGDGRKITYTAFTGRKETEYSAYGQWQQQGNLPVHFWIKWQQALLQCVILTNRTIQTRYQLIQWTSTMDGWPWVSDDNGQQIYEVLQGRWKRYKRIEERTRGEL